MKEGDPVQTATVRLSVYDWHLLLGELEKQMSIINRDITQCQRLYADISTQLCQMPVKMGQAPLDAIEAGGKA